MKISKLTLVFFVALVTACGNKKQEVKSVDPVNIEVETAGAAVSVANRSYVGEVQAEKTTTASSMIPGTVTQVYVEEGQHVSQGQVIASLDASQSKNALQAAQAVLKQAQDAYDRMKVLHEKKAISDMDWMGVQSKLEQAQSSVAMARQAVNDNNVKAPCSGVVGKKYIESGMTVLPSMAICEIMNVSSLKVKISVPEKEVSIFNSNTRTKLNIKALNLTVDGGSVEVGVAGSTMSRSYDVLINLSNAGGKIKPGMVCDVTLVGNAKSGQDSTSISLPITAVHRRASGDTFVWKTDGKTATRVKVTTGAAMGNRVEITSGVVRGDRIVTEGYQKLSEGSAVKIGK